LADAEHALPPANAKVRPVGQIDLVPTLALLLGIPIPFNSLGRPIEEAFVGPDGNDWDQLAVVSRLSAGVVKRYQEAYFAARGMSVPKPLSTLWTMANAIVADPSSSYVAWTRFQEETLATCKELWARFDLARMTHGVAVMAMGILALLLYATADAKDNDEITLGPDEPSYNFANKNVDLPGTLPDHKVHYKTLHRRLTQTAAIGYLPGLVAGIAWVVVGDAHWSHGAGLAALSSSFAVVFSYTSTPASIISLLPTTVWGWLAILFTLGQSIGFASNSFTIWEDRISLFFTATFAAAACITSFRLPTQNDRTLAVYHSIMLIVLARVTSLSRLCRDEQMPYCTSTYYASLASSTSAPWQLAIPLIVAVALPSVVRSFMTSTGSYGGFAPSYVGVFFRSLLLLSAAYWFSDAADNAAYFGVDDGNTTLLKSVGVWIARTALALALAAGTAAFVYAAPPVDITVMQRSNKITVLGFANAHGARYLLLPLNLVAALVLVTKPMGDGVLALQLWQILTLADLLDRLSLKTHPIGAVMLGIMANAAFFATGHQAVLSTIQWDSAFIPLYTIRYPWSPMLIAANTLAGQILAVAAAPLLVLWKEGPRRRGALEHVARRALAPLVAFFATQTLASMVFAGWLRRHLMLYRVFGPRFMMAAVVLVMVEMVAVLVALGGVRANTYGVGDLFGWAD